MVEQFAAPPINPIVSIRPLTTPSPGRDATSAPSPLANLPAGTTIEGFVVNRDASNNPILRTSLGDLQMQSDVFVKTGSAMTIRVDATSESRARIISIDGFPPQDYAAQNARPPAQDTIVTSQLLQRAPGAAPGTAPALPGQAPLQGMLLSTAQPMAANPLFMQLPGAGSMIPPGLMKLQAGAALRVQLLQMELPTQIYSPQAASTAAPATVPARPETPGAPMAGMPKEAPATPSLPKQAIPQTSMASPETARVAQAPAAPLQNNAPTFQPLVAHPGRAAPMVPGTIPSASYAPVAEQKLTSTNPQSAVKGLPGLVIGHEADGGNIVQTGFGTLKIFTPTPLPVHTRLTLEAQPETVAPTQNVASTTPLAAEDGDGLSSLSRGWPHLAEALSWLGAQETTPGRDQMLMLPHVGPKLASGMLFFIAAVKGGDIRQWMGGKRFDQLELKMPELASKLKNDMAQLQQLFLNSPLDQWTGVMLPMLHGDQMDYAKLYLRDEPEDENKPSNKPREQRFIVEIELSHLGEMQFDGFVRQTAPKKQFDLMIRTARPLDAQLSGDIRAMFETAIATTGYNGYLGFQQGAQHFVRPLAGTSTPDERPQDSHTILA